MERLEPCEGKLSRTVLRGGSGGNAAPLPDYCDRAFIGRKATQKETWDLVTFKRDARGQFIRPQWRPIDKSVVEELLGCPL